MFFLCLHRKCVHLVTVEYIFNGKISLSLGDFTHVLVVPLFAFDVTICACETLLYVLVMKWDRTLLYVCTVCYCNFFPLASRKHHYHWDLMQFVNFFPFFWTTHNSSVSIVVNILFLLRICVYRAKLRVIICCSNLSYIYDTWLFPAASHSMMLSFEGEFFSKTNNELSKYVVLFSEK